MCVSDFRYQKEVRLPNKIRGFKQTRIEHLSTWGGLNRDSAVVASERGPSQAENPGKKNREKRFDTTCLVGTGPVRVTEDYP